MLWRRNFGQPLHSLQAPVLVPCLRLEFLPLQVSAALHRGNVRMPDATLSKLVDRKALLQRMVRLVEGKFNFGSFFVVSGVVEGIHVFHGSRAIPG